MSGFTWVDQYDAEHDLRTWGPLVEKVKQRPRGSFRPLLGARRSGKTWALEALKATLGADAVFFDLRGRNALPTDSDIGSASVVLVDEPGGWVFRSSDPQRVRRSGREPEPYRIIELFNWCRTLWDRGVTVAVAPAEWAVLQAAGQSDLSVHAQEILSG